MYAATRQPVDGVQLVSAETRGRVVRAHRRRRAARPRRPGSGIGFGYLCSRIRDIGPGGDARWTRLIGAITGCL
jgi:hypothetical protein